MRKPLLAEKAALVECRARTNYTARKAALFLLLVALAWKFPRSQHGVSPVVQASRCMLQDWPQLSRWSAIRKGLPFVHSAQFEERLSFKAVRSRKPGSPAVHTDVCGQLLLLCCELAAEARGCWLLWQTLHIDLLILTLDLKGATRSGSDSAGGKRESERC